MHKGFGCLICWTFEGAIGVKILEREHICMIDGALDGDCAWAKNLFAVSETLVSD